MSYFYSIWRLLHLSFSIAVDSLVLQDCSVPGIVESTRKKRRNGGVIERTSAVT